MNTRRRGRPSSTRAGEQLRLKLEQLPAALQRGLAAVYLVSGDEPLQVGEAADAIRAAARGAGFADRRVFHVDRSFDWGELGHAVRSLSLFADRRLVELRMPSGKPDKGADKLREFAADPPPDVLLMVISGRLEKKSADAAWVQSIAQRGIWLPIWPIDAEALPGWLRARARRAGVELAPAAAQLIAERVEGNLPAANQELEKLFLLAQGGVIAGDLVKQSVADSARYDVFQLAEAAAAGDAARALRVLDGLRSEGKEPTLVLWALVRELRGLWQVNERTRLRLTQRGGGWNQVSVPSVRALARLRDLPLASLIVQASRTDKIIKGLAVGEAWTALAGLTATLAGVLQPRPVSGRVGP